VEEMSTELGQLSKYATGQGNRCIELRNACGFVLSVTSVFGLSNNWDFSSINYS